MSQCSIDNQLPLDCTVCAVGCNTNLALELGEKKLTPTDVLQVEAPTFRCCLCLALPLTGIIVDLLMLGRFVGP